MTPHKTGSREFLLRLWILGPDCPAAILALSLTLTKYVLEQGASLLSNENQIDLLSVLGELRETVNGNHLPFCLAHINVNYCYQQLAIREGCFFF